MDQTSTFAEVPTLGPAQRLTIGFHHRRQHVSAGLYTQLMERLTSIGGYTEHRELELDRERLLTEGLASFPTTAMLGHGGFSFSR